MLCVVTTACTEAVVYAVFMFACDVCWSGFSRYNSLLGWLLQTKMYITQKINAAFKMVIYISRTIIVMQQDV
jgi:hypothetical protein